MPSRTKRPRESPRVAAVKRRPERDVLVDADRECGGARAVRDYAELPVELELDPHRALDRVRVSTAERRDLRRARVAIRAWPPAPVPAVRRREMLFERDVGREVDERRPFGAHVAAVGAAARRRAVAMALREGPVQRAQYRPFRGHHPGVVDARAAAETRERRLPRAIRDPSRDLRRLGELGDRLDLEIERVAVQPAHRTVRADLAARVAERVQRVHADERRPDPAGEVDEGRRGRRDRPRPSCGRSRPRRGSRGSRTRLRPLEHVAGHGTVRRHDDETSARPVRRGRRAPRPRSAGRGSRAPRPAAARRSPCRARVRRGRSRCDASRPRRGARRTIRSPARRGADAAT